MYISDTFVGLSLKRLLLPWMQRSNKLVFAIRIT